MTLVTRSCDLARHRQASHASTSGVDPICAGSLKKVQRKVYSMERYGFLHYEETSVVEPLDRMAESEKGDVPEE